jgi:sortase A
MRCGTRSIAASRRRDADSADAPMRVRVQRAPLGVALHWIQRALFGGAIVALGYCAFVLGDAWIFQHREERRLARILQDEQSQHEQSAAATVAMSTLPTAVTARPILGQDGLIGRIEIERLALSVVIVEGTGARTLRRTAGHIPGTALPGQIGNVGIAAHRDTFFRPLRNIRLDDAITLTTLWGVYRYRVVSTKIVRPQDVAVLNSDGNEILTLVTCYPFYFVGSAPSRFIVRAKRAY